MQKGAKGRGGDRGRGIAKGRGKNGRSTANAAEGEDCAEDEEYPETPVTAQAEEDVLHASAHQWGEPDDFGEYHYCAAEGYDDEDAGGEEEGY
eukprot:4748601-Prorocentrum_lima.AAC.1